MAKQNLRSLTIAVSIVLVLIALASGSGTTGLMVYPQIAGSENYSVELLSIGSMSTAGSENYSIEIIGYDITGEMGGKNYSACLGWYCSYLRPYSMHLTGRMNYSTGDVVANTPIMLTAYNTTLNQEYNTRGLTDSNGNFDINLNIPDNLLNTSFVIKINVFGKVEAVLYKKCIKDSANNRLECS